MKDVPSVGELCREVEGMSVPEARGGFHCAC
jgi:hypothetical protein